MARPINKLSAAMVASQKVPGLYGDGGGLWLQVTQGAAGPSRSWIFRFTLHGRARAMGLGPWPDVSLAAARERAAAARRLLLDDVDPIEHRSAQRTHARLQAATAVTFRQAAERYIAAHRASWKNPTHAAQWPASLAAYAYPLLGELPVARVEVAHVLKVLEPIWQTKPETASRVRGRLELVLDWAAARGYRAGENPARWRGHLDKLLPHKSKLGAVRHHPALPYAELPAFMADLRQREGVAARALEFLILTAARTSEVTGAKWSEVDQAAGLWIVPGARMKSGREHRVPLAPRALEILAAMEDLRDGDFVFPGGRPKKGLSSMALLTLLRRMERPDVTTHGFRSSFRDWCSERTSYPGELAEMALAHVVKDKTEAAYRRGDLLEKRRRLATEWGRFCATPAAAGEVVTIKGRRR